MRQNEWKYLVTLSFLFALPYLLIVFYNIPIEEYNVHHKVFQLQEDINHYLSQQRVVSLNQQDFTLTLSNFNSKLSESENMLLSIQNCTTIQDKQSNYTSAIQQLTEEVIKMSQSLRLSLKIIQNLEDQVSQLKEQANNIDSQSLKVIEGIISTSISEQLQDEVQISCQALSSETNSTPSTSQIHEICPPLMKSQLVDIISRLSTLLLEQTQQTQAALTPTILSSTDHFEFPNIKITNVVTNLTSPTYQLPQTGLITEQILPSFGLAPTLVIGQPEEAISSNISLGKCWAMKGTQGILTVQLQDPNHIAGFSVEHISKADAIDMSSAPAVIEVYVSSSLDTPFSRLLSRVKYDIHSSLSLQYYPLPSPTRDLYQYIQFKIISNHGNPRYTCLYYLKVHGFHHLNH